MHRGLPQVVDLDRAIVQNPAAELDSEVASLAHRGIHEQCGAVRAAEPSADARRFGLSTITLDPGEWLLDDGYVAGGEQRVVVLGQIEILVAAQHHVPAEPPQVDRQLIHTVLTEREHSQRQVAAFPAVAVRAVHHRRPHFFADPGMLQQLVGRPRSPGPAPLPPRDHRQRGQASNSPLTAGRPLGLACPDLDGGVGAQLLERDLV